MKYFFLTLFFFLYLTGCRLDEKESLIYPFISKLPQEEKYNTEYHYQILSNNIFKAIKSEKWELALNECLHFFSLFDEDEEGWILYYLDHILFHLTQQTFSDINPTIKDSLVEHRLELKVRRVRNKEHPNQYRFLYNRDFLQYIIDNRLGYQVEEKASYALWYQAITNEQTDIKEKIKHLNFFAQKFPHQHLLNDYLNAQSWKFSFENYIEKLSPFPKNNLLKQFEFITNQLKKYSFANDGLTIEQNKLRDEGLNTNFALVIGDFPTIRSKREPLRSRLIKRLAGYEIVEYAVCQQDINWAKIKFQSDYGFIETKYLLFLPYQKLQELLSGHYEIFLKTMSAYQKRKTLDLEKNLAKILNSVMSEFNINSVTNLKLKKRKEIKNADTNNLKKVELNDVQLKYLLYESFWIMYLKVHQEIAKYATSQNNPYTQYIKAHPLYFHLSEDQYTLKTGVLLKKKMVEVFPQSDFFHLFDL